MLKLIIEDDEGKTTVVPLIRDEISIGRKEGNTIRLTERNVSRRHAKLLRQNGQLFIEDLQSYNGIRLNGNRIAGRVAVADGDRIQIGDYQLALKQDPVVTSEDPFSDLMRTIPLERPIDFTDAVRRDTLPMAFAPVTAPLDPEPTEGAAAAPGAEVGAVAADSSEIPTLRMVPGPAVAGVAAARAAVDQAAGEAEAEETGDGAGGYVAAAAAAGAERGAPVPSSPGGETIGEQPAEDESAEGEAAGATPAPAVMAEAGTVGRARLVIVSANLFGLEFSLPEAEVLIGRTAENDIRLDHKSISRQHAKIVFDRGHHVIIDLYSANGVRVNGEEYAKVELRRGDLLDLGHVRLRYVEAGEDFVCERDAEVFDSERGRGRGHLWLWAAGALLGLLVAGLVAWRAGLFEGTPWSIPMPQPLSGDAQTQSPPPESEKQATMLAVRADEALRSERWPEAAQLLGELLRLDPRRPGVAERRQRAEAEGRNQQAFERFHAAMARNDQDGAVAAWNELPEDSVYKSRGQVNFAVVKRLFVSEHLRAARRAQDERSCAVARREADRILVVEEHNPAALEILRACGAGGGPASPRPADGVAVAARVPRAGLPRAEQAVAAPPVPARPAVPAIDVAATLDEATGAYVGGQYRQAILLARRVLSVEPRSVQAHRIIGAASCYLKDGQQATAAFRRVDDQSREYLRSICQKHGVEITP